jgi:hypothetical protein
VSVSGGIWGHYESWWAHRNDDNVMWLFYEDLKDDLPACVELIAKFMGIALDDELKEITCERSSFKFMSENGKQFDDHFLRNKLMGRMGLGSPDEPAFTVGKVRPGGGSVGSRNTIPDTVKALLEARWEASLAKSAGVKDYNELRDSLSPLKR